MNKIAILGDNERSEDLTKCLTLLGAKETFNKRFTPNHYYYVNENGEICVFFSKPITPYEVRIYNSFNKYTIKEFLKK